MLKMKFFSKFKSTKIISIRGDFLGIKSSCFFGLEWADRNTFGDHGMSGLVRHFSHMNLSLEDE